MTRETTTNASGRTLDINLFGGDDLLSFSKNQQVAGVLKMANIFSNILLTPKGSDLSDPSMGSILFEFYSMSSSVISASFLNIAISQAAIYMKNAQRDDPTIPSDELLDTAQLIEFVVTADAVTMKVQLISEAGSDVTVILPINRS